MTTVASIETVEAGTMKKIHWRILPLVFVIYLVAFLDRANVAYAKLTMSADLGFSEAVYGFGAGVFFAGYLLLEIPGALIVQKFGGTSVGSVERIRNVARRVAKWHAAGHRIVVVPSAMAGETNRLLALAAEVQPNPEARELDVIAATGEQVTVGLLAMALLELGVKARSYTGWQVKVLTTSAFTKARIISTARTAAGQVSLDVWSGRACGR